MDQQPPTTPDAPTTPLAPGKPPIWKRKWFLGVSVMVFVIIAASLASAPESEQAADRGQQPDTQAAPAASTTPSDVPAAPSAPRFDTFGDGTWVVGSEIKPGTYRAPDAADCYWARLKNFNGDLDSIKANGTPSGPEIVTITKSDKGFETNGCGTWTSDLSRISASTTSIEEGTWIVGVDIKPGTYRANAGDGCYWARLKDFKGELGSIIANDLPSGRTIVTIKSSDEGFTTNGCGTWERA